MPRILLTLAVVGIAVYALADLARTDRDKTGDLPKWLWAVLIVLVPAIGALAWIAFRRSASTASNGRPTGSGHRPATPGRSPGVPGSGPVFRRPAPGTSAANRRGPSGPDDDPEFLRRLDDNLRRENKHTDPEGHRPNPEDSGDPQR